LSPPPLSNSGFAVVEADVEVDMIPAGPADMERIIELMHELYRYDRSELDERKAREALVASLGDPTWARSWLIQANEETAGYLILTFGFSMEYGGRDAIVDEFFLRAAYRRRGLGSQVVDFLKEFCRSEGIRALHLEVFDHNQAAYEFYRRQGFRERNSRFMSLVF
jgi:GNAT superfamily N-acetyltransferase